MVSDPVKATVPEDIFAGGGEMGALMRNSFGDAERSLDWSQTLLGPVSQWAQSLKTAVSIILNSHYPMLIWWGSEYANLYNDAYRPILGASKHPQFLGKSAKECWAEVWDVIGPLADSVLTTGEPTWSDNLLLMMDRYGYVEETYFTFSYSPIRDESGGVGGVFCAVIETTERIIGERRLRTLRELASNTAQAKTVKEACHIATQTLSHNPDCIPFALLYLVEADGKQARLVETTGIEPGTLERQELIDLTQETDCWHLARVKRTGQAEVVDDFTTWFGALFGATGKEPPNAALVMPIAQSGHKQQLAGFLVVGISPRRAFDDDYRGFFDLIASNVATAIANASAYEAERKRAEALAELDRAKTAFFSNISHEFRTPLTLMLGPLEDVLTNPSSVLPRHDREQLEMVQRNGLRLLKLVNSLLDFSRIEAGRVQAVYEPTDLAMLTAELASVFRSGIERAGLRLLVNCPPLPEPVYVDQEMWEKIVLNLLSNAFKFTFEGEIAVTLRYCNDHVELDVRDTGIGIPGDELPHVFERFHRVKGAQARTHEGSGIGLSLVQELVKLHGGTIQVSSVVNQGTCFTVLIPRGTAHLPSERIGATRSLASTAVGATPYVEEALRWLPEEGTRDSGQGTRDKGRVLSISHPQSPIPNPQSPIPNPQSPIPNPQSPIPRILLADDNADMRDYVKRLLSQRYDVEAVANGTEALATARAQLPDLILSDVMMPGMDGFELLRELRADPHTREIPMILLSARAGEESRIEGLEAGADDYLVKPFSGRELLARVNANLEMARLRQETTRREQELRAVSETAQRAAEATRDQISNILESITDAFVAFDHQWRYTYVNQQATKLLHKTREELLGKQVWEEVFPETVGNLAYQEFHRAVTEQVAVVFEEFGQPIGKWLEVHAYPSPDGLAVYFRDISERKQAEEALKEQERKYRYIFEAAGVAIFEEDFSLVQEAIAHLKAQGVQNFRAYFAEHPEFLRQAVDMVRIVNVNDTAVRMFGAQNKNELLASLDQVFIPETLEVFVEELLALANSETYFEAETILQTIKGERLNVLFTITFPPPTAKFHSVLVSIMNITERKQAEAAVQASEERFRSFVEANVVGILFSDVDGGISEANDEFLRIVGYTQEDIKAGRLRWIDITPPEHLYLDELAIAEAKEKGACTPYEKEYIRKDGSRVPVVIGYSLVGESRHKAIAFILDISERKQALEALRHSEERFQAFMNNSPAASWMTDADGRVIYLSQTYYRIFKLPTTDALGKSIFELYPTEIAQQFLDNIRTVAQTKQVVEAIEHAPRTDGTLGDFLVYKFPIADVSGQCLVGGVAVDITERERALRERHLAEQALHRQTEQLIQANRIKDEFLAVLSHELRTPLNPILGWSKLLRARKHDEATTARALETIERNAKLQTELIEDLLDVSRILQGKLSLKIGAVDLASTIAAAIETVQLAAQAKSIQLVTVLEENIRQVSGDSGRLQQVVWNLLSNAIKFTPEGGQVEIRLESLGSVAQLQVRDTGKGIALEFLPHVFEYFRQADATTTRKFGGLGLGLAIVRHIVELHGGTVKAESLGEGLGATFTVTLPVMKIHLHELQSDRQSDEFPDLNGLKVLVVDDEVDTRELIAFILEQSGAEVTQVASATEALQALTQFKPNVLLSDIGMPEVNGYMLMRQIRAMPANLGGQIPAIALTAYAGDLDYQQAIAAGFQQHIAKPVEPAALVAAVANLADMLLR
ncbi:multi-sensor hybrid histidine kinase [Kalymmatonema gypsitolerans NIES-4073]|nr:multi-sensor hybrid histidine kinase [Scytonema sp. NIES-4073]